MGIFPQGQSDNLKEQADNLISSVKQFTSIISQLPEPLFLKKMDGWAPRDVTAHLIGWNIYSIKGGKMIMQGETPPFWIDTGEDFRKVNEVLKKEHNSTDRVELIQKLEASAEKLKELF